ncbi:MAG: endonuclease III [Desulfuromonas sp.]|nr:MAG: endonuclease III [Desulfuromonas sp.]
MRYLSGRSNALETLDFLEALYPEAECALVHKNPYELLVATILSAQCTDVRVNVVTSDLFRRFANPEQLASANITELEELIKSTGFFRNKARNLIACARMLVSEYGGSVPADLDQLIALPGVGRKTANVVLGNAFGIPGMVVDTHVKRIAYRLGWSRQTEPEKVELDLMKLLPAERWNQTSHTLIYHGRAICKAPVPVCSACPLSETCPRNGVRRSK